MRYVYDFAEGSKDQKDLLGGKGAGLAEMTNLGLRVPPGFTITTDACRVFMERGKGPDGVWDEIGAAIGRLEESTGRSFGGGGKTPLLVSVRSGAKFSMPGMMDTILNLGINDLVVKEIAEWSGSASVAWDIYRRFLQMFGKVVLGVPGEAFEGVLTELREAREVATDAELTPDDLEAATVRFRGLIEEAGHTIPSEPMEQLHAAVTSVFSSWGNRRAVEYRRLHDISEDLGTACNIQTMIFGDLGEDSGTGVCFTRDPSSGEPQPFGDYLVNAQGEDVVAGIRNTLSLADLKEQRPEIHAELIGVMDRLERHYRDMCDIEFTVENGTLWILQTRVGKRTARAAVRLAVDMADEGIIDRREAVLRVDPAALEQLQRPTIAENAGVKALAQGVAALPGAASGEAVFDSDRAVERASDGTPVVLVRHETTPDDIHGMAAAQGILTSRGGKTSHAAVVARGMGKPAVTGAAALNVNEASGLLTVGGVTIREGEVITIDGTTGDVYGGEVPLVAASEAPELEMLLAWADEFRTMGVRANADTPADATRAREAGAEGIGLARTEHMFMGERLAIVQQIILSDDPEVRNPALERLRTQQTEDFAGLLEAMDGLPVIIRLLDPPLHEFLPSRLDLERERRERAEKGQAPDDRLAEMEEAVGKWEEHNPMLGLRGVRLGLLVPELYRIQVQAALQAMRLRTEAGGDPRLEIMVPLVSTAEELRRVRTMIESEIADVFPGETVHVPIGTMIELPRAALLAGDIAGVADFFSFGTNDLTQTTYGLSRDDADRSFLPFFLEHGIYPANPFQTMDEHGVGRLVEMGTAAGKEANPSLEVGVCGEHGGDPGLHRVVLPDGFGLRVGEPAPHPRRPAGGGPGGNRRSGIDRVGVSSGNQSAPAPIDRRSVLRALEPFGRSRTLPGEAYLSPEVYSWEIEHIFNASWLCLRRVDDLLGPGEARAVSAGRARLLLVHDSGGELRGFHNTCRHRGHELLPEDTVASVRQLRCPYHSWTYGLDGSLRSAPSFTGTAGFNPGEYPLIPVQLADRHGWVFARTAGDFEELGAHFGNLDELLDPYDPGGLIEAARHEYVVEANWKLLVENYHECYHCTSIHPALCKVSPPDSGVDLVPTGRWCGGPMELADHAETMSFDGKSHGLPLPGLDPQQLRKVLYVGLFPNLLISAHPDYVMTHRLTPLAADRTAVECIWLFPPEARARPGFDPAYAVDFWDVTNREDWSACEGVQRGLSGGAYLPGPLSRRESTLHQFYAMVGSAYLGHPVLASRDAVIPR